MATSADSLESTYVCGVCGSAVPCSVECMYCAEMDARFERELGAKRRDTAYGLNPEHKRENVGGIAYKIPVSRRFARACARICNSAHPLFVLLAVELTGFVVVALGLAAIASVRPVIRMLFPR